MIGAMRAGALVLLLVLPTGGLADCASERDFVVSALFRGGFDPVERGTSSEKGGQCRVAGIVVMGFAGLAEVGAIEWRLDGLEALESGEGTVALAVDLTKLNIVPIATDNPWLNYLMREQNRRNFIDGQLRASWDIGAGVFEVREFAMDFPGRNRIALTTRTEGMSTDLISGAMGALAALKLAAFEIEVEHHGYFDGAIIGFLVGQYLGASETPETSVAATKLEAKAFVAELPDAPFPKSSKAALIVMIDEAPVPWGHLSVRLRTEVPLELAKFPGLGLAAGIATPGTLEEVLQGAFVDIRFEPSDGRE